MGTDSCELKEYKGKQRFLEIVFQFNLFHRKSQSNLPISPSNSLLNEKRAFENMIYVRIPTSNFTRKVIDKVSKYVASVRQIFPALLPELKLGWLCHRAGAH